MIFSERINPDTRIIAIDDSREDILLRLELIKSAKYSIKIINFTQPIDEIGYLFIGELREACGRGVRVQFIFEELYLLCDDRKKIITTLISDSRLKKPGEVISLTRGKKKKVGFAFTDLIHEKILIIDGEYPSEVLVIGGRGHDGFTLKTLDSAFALYRQSNESTLPWIGKDLINYFNEKWDFFYKLFGLNQSSSEKGLIDKQLRKIKQAKLNFANMIEPRTQKSVEVLIEQLMSKAESISQNTFSPDSLQLITNNLHVVLYENWLKTKKHSEFFHSKKMEKNDITNFIEEKINNSSFVELISYTFSPPEHIMLALESMISRGGKFRLLTNDKAAHAKTFPTSVGYDLTCNSLIKLFSHIDRSDHQKISIYLYDGILNKEVFYLHKKQLVIDDIFFIGTDNFTKSSACKNSEFVLIVKDLKMLAKLNQKTEKEITKHFNHTELILMPSLIRNFFLKITGIKKLAEALW